MNENITAHCLIAFNKIIPGKNLKENKLTLSEYIEIEEILHGAALCQKILRTKNKHVINWFIKHGAKVEPCGIGWHISL